MIECQDVEFRYPGSPFSLCVPDLRIAEGESVALVGPSGSGKTTLLHLIAGLLLPEWGSVSTAGARFSDMSPAERQRFRIATVGMVPQSFDLLDYLTVEENILLPYRVSRSLLLAEDAGERGRDLADRAGIGSLLGRRPERLSQGERQRVAICRGLVTRPRVVLADEPTGNLDPDNQDRSVSLLLDEATAIGATVLTITHEVELRKRFGKVIDIRDLRGIDRKGAAT